MILIHVKISDQKKDLIFPILVSELKSFWGIEIEPYIFYNVKHKDGFKFMVYFEYIL